VSHVFVTFVGAPSFTSKPTGKRTMMYADACNVFPIFTDTCTDVRMAEPNIFGDTEAADRFPIKSVDPATS